ncbi:hypothetical protein JCM10908_001725 [Rhodotorula pacifica]|uniref:uncharacterized protein n=1 Tax=Rhodotorula pacifica TaxID=1495444 RepID=UPI00316D227F
MSPSRGRCLSLDTVFSRLLLPMLLVACFLIALPPALAAPTNADMITYLGGKATGQSLKTVAYTLTVLANDEKVLVSFAFDGKVADVGWMGWGAGTAMTDADIVICWPNSDGTWTLSHRSAPSTVMPTLVGGSANKDPSVDSSGSLRVVASLSSKSASDSPAVVTFERPLKLGSGYKGKGDVFQLQRAVNQPMIYAYGPKNPGKAAQDADLTQHALDKMGGTYLDLSAAFTEKTAAIDPPITPVKGGSSGSVATTAAGQQQEGGSGSSSTKVATQTGGSGQGTGGGTTIESAATGGTAIASPTAGVSGSTTSSGTGGPTTTGSGGSGFMTYSNLILIHAVCAGFACQGYLTTPVTLIALGAVVMAVQAKGGNEVTFTHQTIGFAFVGALIVQDLLGLWTHLDHAPSRPGRLPPPRAPQAWVHMFLGIALIVTGYFQVHLGMERYGVSDDLIIYAYYGAIGFFALAYLGSLVTSMTRGSARARPALPHHHEHHHEHHHHHHHFVPPAHRAHNHRHERRKKGKKRRPTHSRKEESDFSPASSSSHSDDSASGSASDSGGSSRSGSSGGDSRSSKSDSSSEDEKRGRKKVKRRNGQSRD